MQRRRRYLRAVSVGAVGLIAGCESPSETETASQSPAGETPTGDAELFAGRTAKLTAGDTYRFGRSVTLSSDGETALVGTPSSGLLDGTGSAAVFTRGDGEWQREATVTGTEAVVGAKFGYAVALTGDGTVAVVGAPDDEDGTGEQTGMAYVFARAEGEWRQQSVLAAADGASDDRFGGTVAIADDGETALVGAVNHQGRDATGAVYAFTKSSGEWRQQSKLLPSDAPENFAWSLALSADGATAAVGTPGVFYEDSAGAAYVFSREGETWRQRQKLTANDGDDGDELGSSVALSADGATALVGAANDEDPNGASESGGLFSGAGSAYVFTRADGDWAQQAKLAAADGDGEDYFGSSVALDGSGELALVGAVFDEDPNGSDSGSAYTFTADSGWDQQSKLTADDGGDGDNFGSSVALDGDGTTALVGAMVDDTDASNNAGSVYVFE